MRDWHGIERAYVRDGSASTVMRDLARVPLVLDRGGVLSAWGHRTDPFATIVAGVRRAACRARVPRACDWPLAFEAAVEAIARTARDPIVALGGGVDAAAVLVAWRATGRPMPAACTLATGLPDYDEVDAALAIARTLDVHCEVIRCSPDTLVAAAPDAAVIAETPLYNLHPVHRLVLARELHRRGYATLVTGDGADAVFAGAPDLDYVPIVAALTRPLVLASPFFADAIVDGTPRDASKSALRTYVRVADVAAGPLRSVHETSDDADARHDVRDAAHDIAGRPKRPRLVPALALDAILDRGRITQLAHRLDLAPRLDTDRARVGWATLDHLVRTLEQP